MSQNVALMANRLKDMVKVHPDQDNSHVCSKCGETVGIYPSGVKALKENPGAEIICVPCAEKQFEPDDMFVSAGTVGEIAQEARDSVRRQ